MNKLGAQLYTIRKYVRDDDMLQKAMAEIKKIGYTSVQLYGSAENAKRLAAAAKSEGLDISGILADMDTYEQNLGEYVAICKEYNMEDLAVSGFCTELEDVRKYIRRANSIAKTVKEKGLTFSYHNHASEFIRTGDGRTVMEHYIEGFDPDLVDFMPDTYWVHSGGFDVRRFLEMTRGRVKILHLKDMKLTKDGQIFAEIGNGNLYFPGIIRLALECGIQQFVVEQDACDGDPLCSLKQSFDYIQSLQLL